MGYVKDNFPGSPAQFQRAKVAKGVVVYTLVIGALIYAFSPSARRHREQVKNGEWVQSEWHHQKKIILESTIKVKPYGDKKQIQRILEEQDKKERQDFTGPDLYKKIKEFMASPSPISDSDPKSTK